MPLASLIRVRSRQGRQTLVDQSGVALIEFALVLPLLLLVILGIVDFGKAFGYKNQETHLANEAIGAPVKVTINYAYNFFGFLHLVPVTVGASSTMRLEKNWGDSNGNYRPDDFTPGSPTDRYTATGASSDSC